MATLELNGKSLATQTSSAEPVLASTVTGGAGLSGMTSLGTVTTGTLGANVVLDHDAQKYAWHLYLSSDLDASDGIIDFNANVFIGTGVSEAAGLITIDANGGGLYLISASTHNYQNNANDHNWYIRVDGTNVDGARVYHNWNGTGSVSYYGPAGTIAVPIRLDDGATVGIHGNGYINAGDMSWFAGVRIGAKT
jgi:hypothetical protein